MTILFSYTEGSPMPLGAHLLKNGVNFALFSRNATQVWLLLFEKPADTRPAQVIELKPSKHRTGDIWHIFIEDADCGQAYAFKVNGPFIPELGHRFTQNVSLLDPYATATHSSSCWDFSQYCINDADALNHTPDALGKGLVTRNYFDWEGDRPLKRHWSDLVIYEAHVKGLTYHASSKVSQPGTFQGIIEKIPYFKELGINAIELMPLQAFNPCELTVTNPFSHERLVNYWGYSTIGFFAPHEAYGSQAYPGCQVNEFKTMVKELHKAGIEVLLDVVFNHTAEGDETGPTLNFKGLDNSIYYILNEEKKHYANYSGCGNTINCNHPVVRNYILDCLRYWVVEMHVDGFRFDLASILGRDRTGHLAPNPPLLEQIAEDPILREVKLIAEAWDAGGAYLVGRFPGERWSEWNGQFRDDVRKFWRGDACMIGALAQRLCGSADLYDHSGKAPVNSINFITCHDGFTLHDLVSYQHKHNLANGEENRDGSNDNFSANYGVEGPTDQLHINRLRLKQKKNMLATLFLSRGVPMILSGDEFGRSQQGNNNAYCQDNALSWLDWELVEKNRELLNFTQNLIRFRQNNKTLSLEQFYRPDEITWFNAQGTTPNWHEDSVLACHIHARREGEKALCLFFNATEHAVDFPLPNLPRGSLWSKVIDTDAKAPHDIFPEAYGITLLGYLTLYVPARTLIVLAANKT